MENLQYYLMISNQRPRSHPVTIMRRYINDGIRHDEEYFNGEGWTATEFFSKYRLGHTDHDYIEVPKSEAEAAIAEKLRQKAERRN